MRIRKNAKISPLWFCSNASLPSSAPPPPPQNRCQLNQSPWDVIPFPLSPPTRGLIDLYHHHQAAAEGGVESVAANDGGSGDSVGALESVASMKISTQRREEEGEEEKLSSNDVSESDDVAVEGEGIKCETINAQTSPCRSSVDAAAAIEEVSFLRRHHRGARKTKSLSRPYEFYYYSGFGPLWSKRRGAKPTPSPSSEEIDNGGDDGDEELDFEDDGEDDENVGRKRIRSLKSLM